MSDPDGELWKGRSFTEGEKTTAVWNVVDSSRLWTTVDLTPSHYHPRKLHFLEKLEACASGAISDYFLSVRELFSPSDQTSLPPNSRVYDLTDALGNFLREGVPVVCPDDVGSTKKVAEPGDVVISRLRPYLREVAVVPDKEHTFLLSSEFIVLRRREGMGGFTGEFLLPYLLSEPVQTVLRWSQQGSNHPRFPESLLLGLPLPDKLLLGAEGLNSLVSDAMSAFELSSTLYADAEAVLLSELGLDDLDLRHERTYVQRASRVWEAGRLDATYFRPRYQDVIDKMSQSGKTIGDVAEIAQRRFEAQVDEEFQYIEIGGVGRYGQADSTPVPGEEAPSRAQWVVREGDVLTSTVRPIRRLSALVEPEQDGFVCTSGFAILRATAIEPEVLLVYLRLPIVCEIMDLHTTASMYPAISQTDLLSIPIAIPSDEVRAGVSALIQQSQRSRRQSRGLLEEAKQRVEKAVLGKEAC